MKSDPTLLTELRKYGDFDTNACLQCGACTVVCSLASNTESFPRRPLRYARLGLKGYLLGSLEPWLCYYCGECSTTCPRQANPAESMMTLRRYLSAQYDWTWLTARFYKSRIWQIGALVTAALVMLATILLFFRSDRLFEFGHIFELSAIFTLALLVLAPNVVRMFQLVQEGTNPKPSFSLYLREIGTFMRHAITQVQLRKCKDKSFWLKHLFVVSGYLLTLILAALGGWFRTYAYPPFHPIKVIGIIVTTVLLVFLAILVADRIRKREERQKHAQLSDWLFPVGLFTMIFTLVLAYLTLSLGMKEIGYVVYVIHLTVLVQWALVIVPFSKWTHFLYRPLAIYFQTVKEKTVEEGVLQKEMTKEAVPSHAL